VHVIRQALAIAVLVAVAASAAEARHHGKARVGNHNRVGTASVPHAKGAPDNGPRPGTSSHSGVDVDRIFVRPPAHDAKRLVKPLTTKQGAALRPPAPAGHRRQRLDPGIAAKNAIGAAKGASVDGAGRTGPAPNAIGGTKLDPRVAHIGPPGISPPAPGTGARVGTNGGSVNAGHAPIGPTGLAPPSAHGINGTGFGRPGYGPATIGGPAKLAAGVTGTGMKPKR